MPARPRLPDAFADDQLASFRQAPMANEDIRPLSAATTVLFQHWSDRVRALGRLPGRRDIDLQALRHVLPNLWLLGVERDPLRFRLRLIGEAIRAANHDEIRPGVYVDALATRFGNLYFLERLHEMVRTGRADHYEGPPTASHFPELSSIERLSVPLADDGTTVDRILNCTISVWRTGRPPRPVFGR